MATKRKKLCLINPKAEPPSFWSAEALQQPGGRGTVQQPSLAAVTVAAVASEFLHVEIVEENVVGTDYHTDAEIIGVTGNVSQWPRMKQLAKRFRALGRLVVFGGPQASLAPQLARKHCDVLVRGEVEGANRFVFEDLAAGTYKAEYQLPRPGLVDVPMPRWELYPVDRALAGVLQTSRGCPFACDFCEIPMYGGKKQRFKSEAQVIREIETLQRLGFEQIFLSDDNFTASKRRAKEILRTIRDWNAGNKGHRLSLVIQSSVDAARDDELLELCGEAGVVVAYVGLESPNAESLTEAHKLQNTNQDLRDSVQRYYDHGIEVMAGFMVGFDADGTDIFRRQQELIEQTSVPLFTLTALFAPMGTSLYERVATEGRLLSAKQVRDRYVLGVPIHQSNFTPKNFTPEQLAQGIWQVMQDLYRTPAFGERLLTMASRMGGRPERTVRRMGRNLRSVDRDALSVLWGFKSLGDEEAALWSKVSEALDARPDLAGPLFYSIIHYMQVRCAMESYRNLI